MAIFKPTDPQKKLAAARVTRDNLIERKKVSDATITEQREKARTPAASAADDVTLTKVENAMRSAEDRSATFANALSDIEKEISTAEAEIAGAADQKLRAATASSIDALITRWESDQAAFMTATQTLQETSREVSLLVLDGHGTSAFLMAAHQQIPAAGAVILQGLRAYKGEVLAGRARPEMLTPTPEPPRSKLVEAGPTREVIPLKHLKFTHEGKVVICGAYQRHSLPSHFADLAIKRDLATTIGDPRVKDRIGLFGVLTPSPASCIALDDTPDKPATSSSEPILSSSELFTPMDRGPAVVGRMPVRLTSEAMTGTRSMGPEEEP